MYNTLIEKKDKQYHNDVFEQFTSTTTPRVLN